MTTGRLVAEAIPFKDFKDRIQIIKNEERKNKTVTVYDKHILVFSKYKNRKRRKKRS